MKRAFTVLALVGFGALIALAILTMADATLRTLGWSRIPGFEDISQLLLAVLIASGFPIALLHRRHVRIDALGRRLSQGAQRWLDLVAAVIVLAVFVVMVIQMAASTAEWQTNQRVTSTLRLAVAPWWWLTTILVALSIPAQLAVIVELLRGKDD